MVISKERLATAVFLGILLAGCGGGSGDGSASSVANSEGSRVLFGPGSGQPDPRDLSNIQLAVEAIQAIPGIEIVDVPWIYGEWASYWVRHGVMHDSKLTLFSNHTFEQVDIGLGENGAGSTIQANWFVFKTPASERLYFVYYGYNNDGSGISFQPIEREGNDSLRFIYHSTTDIHSNLYTRLGSAVDSISPGMPMLGRFEFRDYDAPAQNFLSIFSFNGDGSVVREIYGNHRFNNALQFRDFGNWRLDGSTLRLSLGGQNFAYTITAMTMDSLSLSSGQDTQFWQRVLDPQTDANIDPFAGEYQGAEKEQYLSISRNGGGYLVEIAEAFQDTTYANAPAQIRNDGQLSISLPPQFNGETELVLNRGYNRLWVTESPGSVLFQANGDYLQKASNLPILNAPTSVLGGWRFTAGSYHPYYKFYNDGSYISDSGIIYNYGNFSVQGNQLVLDPVCGGADTKDIIRVYHRLKSDNIYYNPIPALTELGDVGVNLKNIIFEHDFDTSRNSVPLRPHPEFSGVYVFAQETEFSDVFRAFTLRPDGSGYRFLGSSGYVEDPDYPELYNYTLVSFVQNIEYYVAIDGDRETLVFYNKGAWTATNEFGTESFGIAAGDSSDFKTLDLYHGRTALCYKSNPDSAEYPLPIVRQ